jgi:hypothetical protein
VTDATLSSTTSLCPTCLERVPGTYEARDDAVYLTRECAEHGVASRKVWDSLDHWEWAGEFSPDLPERDRSDDDPAVVDDGGDLTVDNDHACLAVVEVTQECNLSCSFCFASSGPGGRELAFGEVVHLLDVVLDSGGPRPIQFSGGEPTIRDDLPELVETATEMGFEHVEVNTNGIVLAREDGYAERLVDAGVTAVYLQFDGLEADTYREIREADLLEHKHAAIEACRRADLPVILVPTVVPGVNDHEMGAIVEFALENLDVVRSVNFQPVSRFGRYADVDTDGRFSLDSAARRLSEQFDAIEPRDLLPAPCCSAYCQSGTALVPTDEGAVPLTRFLDEGLWQSVLGTVDESEWMELLAKTDAGQRAFLGNADVGEALGCCGPSGCCSDGSASDLGTGRGSGSGLFESMFDLVDTVLPVSFTGFMDADAADVDRLGNCCLSVPTPDGDLVPFCGYNMTTDDGEYALRTRHGWGGRDRVTADPESPEIEPAVESESVAESDDD